MSINEKPQDIRNILLNQENTYKRTDKYQVISTNSVIKELEKHGWNISSFKMARVRNSQKEGFQAHQVKLQNSALNQMYNNGLFPEIVINNSYDGNQALNISFGIYRLVCSNGLMAKETDLVQPLSIKHIGSHFQEKVDNFVNSIEGSFNVLLDDINKSSQIILSTNEKIEFANEASKLRLDSSKKLEDPFQLLQINREEDNSNDLFTVFNVIQENLLQGNFSYLTRNKSGKEVVRKSRPITNILSNQLINSNLWGMFNNKNESSHIKHKVALSAIA